MKTSLVFALVALVAVGCGDKSKDAKASASADPVKTEAKAQMDKWEAVCKKEGDRNAKNAEAKVIIDEGLKNEVFKAAHDSGEPAKYGDNYCALGLRVHAAAEISRKMKD